MSQSKIPGVETSKVPGVADACAVVLRLRHEVKESKAMLDESTADLIHEMKKAGVATYYHDGCTFNLEEMTKLKVNEPR